MEKTEKRAKKSFFVLLTAILISSICGVATAATPGEIEEAIEDGIAWLASQQDPCTGYWQSGGFTAAPTGLALIELQERAFELGYTPSDSNYLYSEHVEKGLVYLFSTMDTISISNQLAGNPDTDGDGNGVYVNASSHTYETSIALMAVAASRDPNREVDSPGSDVNGWTYKEVLQDIVDYIVFGQIDGGNGRGGWRYSAYDNAEGDADNSVAGYAVSGLGFAESPLYGFECVIPQFVRDELNIWIDYIQSPDGGSGYATPGNSNILRTGNLIFQMTFYGDEPCSPRLQAALDYLGNTWNDSSNSGWGNPAYGGTPHNQAMYCSANGLWYSNISKIVVDGNDRYWYDDFADALITTQAADGRWIYDPHGGPILATEWALLALRKVPLLRLEKVDDIGDDNCVALGSEINYRIDCNYSPEVNMPTIDDVNIIDYLPDEVDFNSADSNGVYDPYSHTVKWDIGTLLVGESVSVGLKVNVKQCIEPCITIRNRIEVKSINRELGMVFENTAVCCPTLTKSANEICCDVPGGNMNYVICYAANGYGDTNVVISDLLPDEMNFVWASNGGDYDEGSRTVSWNDINFPADACGYVELILEYNPTDEPNVVISNCSVITGDCVGVLNACEDVYKCKAIHPNPADDVTEIPVDAVLWWIDGALSEERDVYFGMSFRDVADANRSNPLGVLVSEGQGPNTFDPYDVNGFIALDKTYYWRIDEVNNSLGSVWRGDVWSFRTSNHWLLDDFESYYTNDDLKDVWYDYYVYGNDTAAEVYLAKSSEGGPTLDERSMEYQFNNHYSPYYSEAWVVLDELGIDNSFVRMDVQSLSIWFYGQASNPVSEKMYVKLTDGVGESAKVLYSALDDMNDVLIKKWQEWNVSIQEFLDNNDINLADIGKITLGFDESAHVDGRVYFDDIRLYATRCVLAKRSADFAKADYIPRGDPAGDCAVNFQEFGAMADYWLMMSPPADANVDLHIDGIIDYRDIAILAENWLGYGLFP